jgi:hypothetical protein
MMSRAIRWLAGNSNVKEAWKMIFHHFNEISGKGANVGYQFGEKVAIKINLTTSKVDTMEEPGSRKKKKEYLHYNIINASDTSPWMIRALIRQLVNEGGAQDYLHEAALAYAPPSETFYDPERDGMAMTRLGVHEHWNNATEKKSIRGIWEQEMESS